jgi:hypothetical protein
MRKLFRSRPSPSMVVALVALVLAAGGVTYAAIPDSSGTIHACYSKSGTLHVIDTEANPPETCRTRETGLDWPGGPVPASGPGIVSRLVRLSVGETKTIIQRGPFTVTASCVDLGSNSFEVSSSFQSSEGGTTYDGVDTPLSANTPFRMLHIAGTQETNEGTFAHIVAPSGTIWVLFATVYAHAFGSDCAEAATGIGL